MKMLFPMKSHLRDFQIFRWHSILWAQQADYKNQLTCSKRSAIIETVDFGNAGEAVG